MRNYPGMTAPSYQTVKVKARSALLPPRRCARTKVASMLAHDPVDRARSASPDHRRLPTDIPRRLDDIRRQDVTRSLRLTPYERK
jgi:hypothetical protein